MTKLKIVLIVICTVAISGYLFYRYISSPDSIARLIKDNIKNYAIVLVKNDVRLISQNPDALMPLASTMKIIIAIEFAEQVAAHKLSVNEIVPLAALKKYYVQNTDGGAHSRWLEYVDKTRQNNNNAVTLGQVAYGMMKYSSNANTEYLIDKLGIDNVNNRIIQLGLTHHQKISYLVSSLFITGDLDKLTNEELYNASIGIHQKLKNGQLDAATIKAVQHTDIKTQKQLSDRLPSSTANEYYMLMDRINKRQYFDPNTQHELEKLLEWPMENNKNKVWATRMGAKGGSTLWILNNAMYVQKNNGDRYEFILFSNQPSASNDNLLIKSGMNNFLLAIFTDSVASAHIINTINNKS